MPIGASPLIPNASAEDAEVRGLREQERFAVFAIAVVLIDAAGLGNRCDGTGCLVCLGDLDIARRNRDAVVVRNGRAAGLACGHDHAGKRSGLRQRVVGDGRGIGVELAVVVVERVALEVHIPALAEFMAKANILEIGVDLIGVVAVIEPACWIGIVRQKKFNSRTGVWLTYVGRGR